MLPAVPTLSSRTQAVLVPLMTNQLVPPVEPLVTIPITAWIEALKGARDGKVFPEMTCKVGVPAESFVARIICAKESGRKGRDTMPNNIEAATNDGLQLALVKKKKLTRRQWQACQTPRLHQPDH